MNTNENETNSDNNPLKEVKNKLVITPEDVKGAADFWTHFEVPMPQELRDAFEKFTANPTVENQEEVKLYLCKAVGHTDHEAFNDEMFKDIVEECRGIVYDMSFDKDLKKTLTE